MSLHEMWSSFCQSIERVPLGTAVVAHMASYGAEWQFAIDSAVLAIILRLQRRQERIFRKTTLLLATCRGSGSS